MKIDDRFCSQLALRDGDPLVGTASADTRLWLMLEYDRPWTARAVEDNDLPPAVQDWLDAFTDRVDDGRVLFIRRPEEERPDESVRLYVAVTAAADQRLYAFTGTLAELMAIDPDHIRRHPAEYADHLDPEPLFLVCTNGKRDMCCAKFGLPVYGGMRTRLPQRVWQSTHLGGHRYAPVMGVFPAGVYYGRVDPTAVDELITAGQTDTLNLDHYRGRTCYTKPVQAAEAFLRRRLNVTGLNDVTLQTAASTTEADAETWTVTFEVADTAHTVTVRQTTSAPKLVGCTAQKSKPQPVYALQQIEVG